MTPRPLWGWQVVSPRWGYLVIGFGLNLGLTPEAIILGPVGAGSARRELEWGKGTNLTEGSHPRLLSVAPLGRQMAVGQEERA
jgi:hypothetical protein